MAVEMAFLKAPMMVVLTVVSMVDERVDELDIEVVAYLAKIWAGKKGWMLEAG